MKYIKTYESNNNYNLHIGDYVIWKASDESKYFEIIEMTRIEERIDKTRYWSRIIYVYENDKLILKNMTNEAFFTESDIENVIYISNNIEDCMKTLTIITDSNKYNL